MDLFNELQENDIVSFPCRGATREGFVEKHGSVAENVYNSSVNVNLKGNIINPIKNRFARIRVDCLCYERVKGGCNSLISRELSREKYIPCIFEVYYLIKLYAAEENGSVTTTKTHEEIKKPFYKKYPFEKHDEIIKIVNDKIAELEKQTLITIKP